MIADPERVRALLPLEHAVRSLHLLERLTWKAVPYLMTVHAAHNSSLALGYSCLTHVEPVQAALNLQRRKEQTEDCDASEWEQHGEDDRGLSGSDAEDTVDLEHLRNMVNQAI